MKIELISRDECITLCGGDGDVVIGVRRLDPDLVAECRRRHTVTHEAARPGEPPRTAVDERAVDQDIYDYLILWWRGVVGPDGADAPCTRETKWRLPASLKHQILALAHAVDTQGTLELELKNSSALSGPPAPGGGSLAGS